MAVSACGGDDEAEPAIPEYCQNYPGGPGTWEEVDTSGISNGPAAQDETAVWNGDEWVVFGGFDAVGLGGGFRYRPGAGTVTATSDARFVVFRHGSVWLEDTMLVWGGNQGGRILTNDGWLYEPATDSWSDLPQIDPRPEERERHILVNTGNEIILWGGSNFNTPAAFHAGWRLDPIVAGWSRIASEGAPEGDTAPFVAWTGSELLVWSGQRYDPVREANGTISWNESIVASGAAYDPITDSWRPINADGGPVDVAFFTSAVWTGTEMIVIGKNQSGAYDPLLDRWRPIALPLQTPFYGSAAWTGAEVIVVTGGACPAAVAYDPAADSWRWLSIDGASPGMDARVAWTGSELLLWGGRSEFHLGTPVRRLYRFSP